MRRFRRWRQARENISLPVVQRDHEVEEVRLPEVGWRLLLEVRPPDAGSPEHVQKIKNAFWPN